MKNSVKITTNLNTTLEYPSQVWSWEVREFPVDYTELQGRCDDSKTGNSLVKLDDIYGYLVLPDNQTSELVTEDLQITGSKGLYGKSIVLRNVDTQRYGKNQEFILFNGYQMLYPL